MFIVFFLVFSFLTASLTESDKAIVLKNDGTRVIVGIGKTMRLRAQKLPENSDEDGVFKFIEAPNGYFIKFKNGFLCKNKKGDAGVVGCKSEESKYAVWKVNMAGESGAQIETAGNLCLLPTGLDNREKTKGRYLQAKPCTDETYLWEIVDLKYSKEEPVVSSGVVMEGNTDWDNVALERIRHQMYDAPGMIVDAVPNVGHRLIPHGPPDIFPFGGYPHADFPNSRNI
ncbi:hypothetical protein VCUG_00804 [Vavraia culicis subsp. floridensis]|uniref:Ricin B lectin domain-containing protein n=1 Tax=Vavraia culicis (isolate floridensis) TaxID=948595 RepID=L2GWI3_VAVCU|nr:uncharacterized protein VCUG_00804 [Vavraia culicis subsp. floridensis]ELA47722.1 hypothetical protein VCUG_00804 [Vavraia culicis subsp. floridensis]